MRKMLWLIALFAVVWATSGYNDFPIFSTETFVTDIQLTDPSVSPDTGYVADLYLFEVTYTSNPWNFEPDSIVVIIDGTKYDSLNQVDPLDFDYTDGAAFFVNLFGTEFRRGTHEYFFYAEDESGAVAETDTHYFTIINTPPEGGTVNLVWDPDPLMENSVINCIAGGFTDDDDDSVWVVYRWYVNDAFSGIEYDSLIGRYFNKHDEIYCLVYPYDGMDYGNVLFSETLTVENTPPEAPDISILPLNPYDMNDIQTIIVTDSYDADGDPITYRSEWYLDTVVWTLMSDTEILDDALTTPGDNWKLNVWPFDGEVFGDGAEFLFDIGAPELTNGDVDPDTGHAFSTFFTYSVTYTNIHNYPPESIVVIIDDIDFYPMELLDTTDHDYTDGADYTYTMLMDVGDHHFEFYAIDNQGNECIGFGPVDGPVMTNELPVIDSVYLTPYPHVTICDTLCAVVADWHDDDSDPVYFGFEWFVNDIDIAFYEECINGDLFDRGDRVKCKIIPFDGFELGDPVWTVEVVIGNYIPEADSAVIEVLPNPPAREFSILKANVFGVYDCDDFDVDIFYRWFVNGGMLPISPTRRRLTSFHFDHGDTVYFVALLYDGIDTGYIESNRIVIVNTLPIIVTVDIEPDDPYTNDTLWGDVDFVDIDGDDVRVEYHWYCDGVYSHEGEFVDPALTSHFDVWQLEVRLFDDFEVGEYRSGFAQVEILNTPPFFIPFIDTILISGENYFSMLEGFDIDGDRIHYGLVLGADGFWIWPSGVMLWSVPIVDEPTVFPVQVFANDGYDNRIEDINLWVYPMDFPALAPRWLIVETGYVDFIPLTWDRPAVFDFPVLPVPFLGYEVWRSTDPDPISTEWEHIASTFVPNYIDNDVDPYTIYYYRIAAIYSVGNSIPSNVEHGFCIDGERGDWYSNFSYYLPPKVDGWIGEIEWLDASYFEYCDGDVKIYLKHTLHHLYIGVKVLSDVCLSPDDALIISVDDNFNRRWPIDSPSNEGEYLLRARPFGNEFTFQGIWGDFATGVSRDERILGRNMFGHAADFEGYVCYEAAIPLFGRDLEAINIPRLDIWFGVRFAIYNAESGDWEVIIPGHSDPEDPSEFGSLYLPLGEGPGSICNLPRVIDMTVRQGEFGVRILPIENCGDGYLSFYIKERCAFVPRGLLRSDSPDAEDIVAFVDDESLVPRALEVIGYMADIYTDPVAFKDACLRRDWKLVIVSSNVVNSNHVWDGVLYAIRRGAKILIQSPDLDRYKDHWIWNILGVEITDDLGDRPSALTIELPWHPFFNIPMPTTPAFCDMTLGYDDYGDCIMPLSYGTLASFDLYPYPSNAAIVTNFSNTAIINALRFSTEADENGDGLPDALQLLINEILSLKPCEDVEWLEEDPITGIISARSKQNVSLTFYGTELDIGTYYAWLMVYTNDRDNPINPIAIRFHVVEPEPRPLVIYFEPETLKSCREFDREMTLMVRSLEAMDINMLRFTVTCDPGIAQPIDVIPRSGRLTDLSVSPGSITFQLESRGFFEGGEPLADILFRVKRDALVGALTEVIVEEIAHNTEAYVTDTILIPGALKVWPCDDNWRLYMVFESDSLIDTLILGIEPWASRMFDLAWDHENDPLTEWFDPYTVIEEWDPDHPYLDVDIRSAWATTLRWLINIGDSLGTIHWFFPDYVNLGEMGTIYLLAGDDMIDMKDVMNYDYLPGRNIEVLYNSGGLRPFEFVFQKGMNLFSMPIDPGLRSPNDLFPGYISCWGYDNSTGLWYDAAELDPGVGYAILFNEAREFHHWGLPIYDLTIDLFMGWNLIGTVYDPVDFSTPDVDPLGAIMGMPEHAFEYDATTGNYFPTDELNGSKGYFVAVNADEATLFLPGECSGMKTLYSPKYITVGKVIIGDEELVLNLGNDYAIPFKPPIPNNEYEIDAYLNYKGLPSILVSSSGTWYLVMTYGNEVKFESIEGYQIEIDGESIPNVRFLSGGIHKIEFVGKKIPSQINIGNFTPNPFNSYTSIDIEVNKSTAVRVEVFSLSGKMINVIVNSELSVGIHTLKWDGADMNGIDLPSGLYLVRFAVGEQLFERKLILSQ